MDFYQTHTRWKTTFSNLLSTQAILDAATCVDRSHVFIYGESNGGMMVPMTATDFAASSYMQRSTYFRFKSGPMELLTRFVIVHVEIRLKRANILIRVLMISSY